MLRQLFRCVCIILSAYSMCYATGVQSLIATLSLDEGSAPFPEDKVFCIISTNIAFGIRPNSEASCGPGNFNEIGGTFFCDNRFGYQCPGPTPPYLSGNFPSPLMPGVVDSDSFTFTATSINAMVTELFNQGQINSFNYNQLDCVRMDWSFMASDSVAACEENFGAPIYQGLGYIQIQTKSVPLNPGPGNEEVSTCTDITEWPPLNPGDTPQCELDDNLPIDFSFIYTGV